MLILFDHGTPRGLAAALGAHSVATAYSMGWDRLSNGDLLKAAEAKGFEVFITTDRRLQYQQNLKDRSISIIVLAGSLKWSQVRLHVDQIALLVDDARPGSYAEMFIPYAGPKNRMRPPE